MAHQSVSQCRFYVNVMEWLSLNNAIAITTSSSKQWINTLPVNPILYDHSTQGHEILFTPVTNIFNSESFVAVLGHDFNSRGQGYVIKNGISDTEGETMTDYVNGCAVWDDVPPYDGFSISTFNGIGIEDMVIRFTGNTEESGNPSFASVIIGTYHTMPHSPDMSLTLGYETGTKTIETRGGSSLSNTMWRPPMWGDTLGAWELHDPASDSLVGQTLAHSSRRTWDLNFSYLSKENTFPKYNALNRLVDANETVPDDETLLTSNDFFSRVYNIVGTALPFIFQPDKDANEFAIAKFSKPISFQQTSPNLYSIKCRIVETW